jgi:hypothetical protein
VILRSQGGQISQPDRDGQHAQFLLDEIADHVACIPGNELLFAGNSLLLGLYIEE